MTQGKLPQDIKREMDEIILCRGCMLATPVLWARYFIYVHRLELLSKQIKSPKLPIGEIPQDLK
jgi:hypothetical protein